MLHKWITLLAAASLTALALPASADGPAPWPQRPVRVVVPYAPGGASDVLARLLGSKLQEAWKQPVVVENRTGAGGNIGTDNVAKSAPDGYTLLLGDLSNFVIAPVAYKNLPYDVIKDFTAVVTLTYSPYMLLVSPQTKANSLKELVDYARAHPGKLNWATTGIGSGPHLAGLQFARKLGIDWLYLPNKGGAQANLDVMGGQADLMFNSMVASASYVRGGKLRVLAFTSRERNPEWPNVPTVAEAVPGFTAGGWQGMLAPAGTPPEVIRKINADVVRILQQPEIRQRLAQLGAEPVGNTPEATQAFVREEKTRWADLIRESGLKLDM
ncbi:Bug family tripartite tricarboxylate transporter substrate binding protein [Cupriavidus basilensis]|uniref:Bug family tripartite tricarboxylate transporter substrate binding protein n=1 Tax=Cupriavidus basilensis TaxID=68895 RepID=UPI002845741D|nr:tripartite tricarboxylate transporter substrate binding protein [Cupriavidus basilensis]MDR3382603.1 tripartite tricarboxylate transporter substrate binding protein [Cupriavidus basilensis]